jgi:hypothetical protein
MILVGADRLQRSEGRSRSALVLFGAGGFVGMATLETFLGPFLVTALVLLLRPSLRRGVIVAVAIVGVATIAWYGPVLSKSLGYQNPNGHPLPWYGFVQAPLRDLLGNGINLLAPGVSVTAGAVVSAVVLGIGAVATWFRRERMLVLVLLAPVPGTYLLLEVASAKYAPRFGAFALLPLLALASLGLATIFRVLGHASRARLVMPILVVCLSLVVLGRFVHYAAAFSEDPYEAAKSAGQIVKGAEQTNPGRPIVANYALAAFNSYVSPDHVRTLSGADLVHMFCTFTGSFIYLEHGATRTLPDTSCLTQRNATQIALPERREKESVWLVPPLK